MLARAAAGAPALLNTPLLLSLAWIIVAWIAYAALHRWRPRRAAARPIVTAWDLALVALLIRLVPALLLPVGAQYDIESYRRVAAVVLQGGDVYSGALVAGRHPYLPLMLYLLAAVARASQVTGLAFVQLVKLPFVLADVGVVVLLYRVCRRLGRPAEEAVVPALLYALNPIPVLVSAYHGQFDALPALLALLAWSHLRLRVTFARRVLASACFLGLAVLVKSWPIILLPILLRQLPSLKQRLAYAAVTGAIPAAAVLVYTVAFQAAPGPLLQRALTYSGVAGWWGYSALVNIGVRATGHGQDLLDLLTRYASLISWAGLLLGYALSWRRPTLQALLTTMLILFTITPGFGLQYLLWVVPFALLAGYERPLAGYTAAAMVFMLPSYYGLHLTNAPYLVLPRQVADSILQLSSVPAWLACLAWAQRTLVRDRP